MLLESQAVQVSSWRANMTNAVQLVQLPSYEQLANQLLVSVCADAVVRMLHLNAPPPANGRVAAMPASEEEYYKVQQTSIFFSLTVANECMALCATTRSVIDRCHTGHREHDLVAGSLLPGQLQGADAALHQ